MKRLQDILYRAGLQAVEGNTDIPASALYLDSREVSPQSVFIALRGSKLDGHNFITRAIENGATSIVCEEMPSVKTDGVTYIKVRNAAEALGQIASNYFDNPSSRLSLVGVTGTNGKTTSVSLLYQVFTALGHPCGLLSTISNYILNQVIPSTHTTPDVISLNRLLYEMVESGCTYCFMEVSSHAVDQQRIAGLSFQGAVFTNLTHDHLDYHHTFDAYLKAKQKFFDGLSPNAFALTNADEKHGQVMVQNTRASRYTYGLLKASDFKARIMESGFEGMLIQMDGEELWTRLLGRFNAYNLLAIYGTARLLGAGRAEVLKALSNVRPAEGRFEYVNDEGGRVAIVDYAHTPDALKNVLETINEVRGGMGQLITVVGAGGDRDASKRPVMAAISARLSSKVILTSDNPRSEDPQTIINEMMQGPDITDRRKVLQIADRREAIRMACHLAKRGDVILVAGKGHEKYQEIQGIKHPFDDKEVVQQALKETL